MSYIGIGSPIPDVSSLPGQTGGEIEVTLDYPSAAVCNGDDPFSPSSATPPGGTFEAEPLGLNINSSTGVVTPVGSTPQAYTISYTVSGVTSQFALTINNVEQSTFSYSASSFQKIGIATPTLASGTTAGGSFSASTGITINNSTGVIDLAASTIGGPYTITYTTPGTCSTFSTFTLSITAVAIELIDNDFVMEFNGTDEYIDTFATPSQLSFPATTVSEGGFSISFWYNHNSISNGPPIIQSTTNYAWNDGFAIRQEVSIGNKLRFWVGNQSHSAVTASVPDSSKWYHIACVFTGGSTYTLKIYVDGFA